MRATAPLRGWLGGKYRLARTIVERIPEHTCYVEPFAGAAWVLFTKALSKAEVLNDINKDIVTLYRVLQWHLEEFLRYFKWALVSREEFERLRALPPDSLTDIQRAARFYYLQKTCFGGRMCSPTFGVTVTSPPRLNLLRIEEELSDAHLRLAGVVLECLPFRAVIARYDRPDTFFYLDPPYWGCESSYGKGLFSRDDFGALAATLAGIKGQFILSLNDVPEIREIFSGYTFEEVSVRYAVARHHNPLTPELLISNYW
ncbi:MAG: DNA adenine methylase [Deltaproteobacteria bacterium]|nr:DNA adenine methylase [Deltaproteobacteria bacterium]